MQASAHAWASNHIFNLLLFVLHEGVVEGLLGWILGQTKGLQGQTGLIYADVNP